MKIERVKDVTEALKKAKKKYGEKTRSSVRVGYTAKYALFVHENIEMKWKGKPRKPNPPHKGRYWDPQGRGQSKFLEQPARELKPDLGDIVLKACRKGATLGMGLVLAALRIMRESQRLVPVEFGNMKGSATVRLEDNESEHWK